MTWAIETRGLSKSYGDTPGITDLNLEVRTGEVFGFIGPNGSGKTTTIRTLMNLLHPTGGSATVLGFDIVSETVEVRRRTGYLPGELAMYPTMTGREFLRFFSNLRGIDTATQTVWLADRFELDLDKPIADYSTGNRHKVGLVNAFMHEPELLILDEPTSGLDPLMQQEFADLVVETRAEGRTVFLSSHILPEVERVADRVGIIRQSRLVATDTLEGLTARAQTALIMEFDSAVSPAPFEALPEVSTVEVQDGVPVVRVSALGALEGREGAEVGVLELMEAMDGW